MKKSPNCLAVRGFCCIFVAQLVIALRVRDAPQQRTSSLHSAFTVLALRVRDAPQQRTSSLHSAFTVLAPVFLEHIFLIAQFLRRTATSNEIYRAIPNTHWSRAFSADFNP